MAVYRRAREDEMDAIMDLVVRTFTGEQDIPSEMNYIEEQRNPHWFCAEDRGRIIGTIAFFQENGEWHAGRFAMEPEFRGRHIGSELIAYAFEEMFNAGAREIIMEGRPATVHILTKQGAEITGEPFPFYRSTCTPMRMTREKFRR